MYFLVNKLMNTKLWNRTKPLLTLIPQSSYEDDISKIGV